MRVTGAIIELDHRDLAILAAILPGDAYVRIRNNHHEDLAHEFEVTTERIDQIASRLFSKIRQYKVT